MLIKGCCWWHELQYIFVARGEFWACYQKRKTPSYGWKQAQTLTTNVITEAIVPVYLIFFVDCCDFQPALKSPNSFLCQYDYWFFFSLFVFVAESSPQKENIFSVKKFTELLQIPAVFFLITVKIITGIPFGIFQSMFSLVSMEYFKLEPQQNGFVMSYVGGLSIVRLQINDKLVLINGYQKLLPVHHLH